MLYTSLNIHLRRMMRASPLRFFEKVEVRYLSADLSQFLMTVLPDINPLQIRYFVSCIYMNPNLFLTLGVFHTFSLFYIAILYYY